MKKLCIFFGLMSSLHGADNLPLRTPSTRMTNAWPLSTALMLTGCGLLVVSIYTAYKTCIQRHARRIKTHDTPAQDNTALIKVAAPYFYAYKCNKLILDKIIQIAARDLDIESLLPHGSEHYRPAESNESYYAPREEYLHRNVFTKSNIATFCVIDQQNKVEQPANVLGTPTVEFTNNASIYTYIFSEADVKKVDPINFFRSTQFLEHKPDDAWLSVKMKNRAPNGATEGSSQQADEVSTGPGSGPK